MVWKLYGDLGLFVAYLTFQQHASVHQGRICSDNSTCCHTETEAVDQTFYLTSHSILKPGAGIMEADDRQMTTVFTFQPSFTIGTRQTEHHEALPSSANAQSHLTSSFADDGNASWYSVCPVPMVEGRLDCEDCRHLTVVGLHDTGPRTTGPSAGMIPPGA